MVEHILLERHHILTGNSLLTASSAALERTDSRSTGPLQLAVTNEEGHGRDPPPLAVKS